MDAPSFPIVELRQYTLHDGRRDTLIDLFERQFVEPQEALGMKIIGTFRDLDRPNRFVWLRGFADMDSRAAALDSFYSGSVWQAHREAANATMIDSDNVLLLRAPVPEAAFHPQARRTASAETDRAGLIFATIYSLEASPDDAAKLFADEAKPLLEKNDIPVLAWFITESAANNYPRLPVREGERVLAWFTRADSDPGPSLGAHRFAAAEAAIAHLLAASPERLRLAPTARSQLR